MERQRAVTALVTVTSLGVILSILGTFIASGIDPVGTLYSTFTLTLTIFLLLWFVSLAFYQQFLNTKRNQSEAEPDSGLVRFAVPSYEDRRAIE